MTQNRRTYRSPVREQGAAATRRRILRAARSALFDAPFSQFTLAGVALRAGVTTQTVRDHFGAKDALLAALGDVLSEELGRARRAASATGTGEAIAVLLAEYETYGLSAARILAGTEHSAALAAMAARGRDEHRAWLEQVFGDRLPSAPAPRERTVAALYAATDVGTWRLLRVDLGHSADQTAAVMSDLVDGALRTAYAPATAAGAEGDPTNP